LNFRFEHAGHLSQFGTLSRIDIRLFFYIIDSAYFAPTNKREATILRSFSNPIVPNQ